MEKGSEELEEQRTLAKQCRLCLTEEATQKNSHIIPSFLCARVLSYDGSGKRGKDVTFSITEETQSVYVGEVPSTEYEELFDTEALSDERIEQLKSNPMSEDDYLCPHCERAFSNLLETPYSARFKHEKPIEGSVGLFFWISVFWRLSITKSLGEGFNESVIEKLRDCLHAYISGLQDNKDVSEVVAKCPVSYKVLYNPDYLRDDAGFFVFRTDANKSNAILLCGDLAVWLGVDSEKPIDFFGLQGAFNDAPKNIGLEVEMFKVVSKVWFVEAKNRLISIIKDLKVNKERDFLNRLWHEMGMNDDMPALMQDEIIYCVHGDELKLGDRGDYKMWASIILKVTNKYLFGGNRE